MAWQLGARRSHSRNVPSSHVVRNQSDSGLTEMLVTRVGVPVRKKRTTLLSNSEWYATCPEWMSPARPDDDACSTQCSWCVAATMRQPYSREKKVASRRPVSPWNTPSAPSLWDVTKRAPFSAKHMPLAACARGAGGGAPGGGSAGGAPGAGCTAATPHPARPSRVSEMGAGEAWLAAAVAAGAAAAMATLRGVWCEMCVASGYGRAEGPRPGAHKCS